MAAVAPWDSIGFQIIATWIVLILLACWVIKRVGDANEKYDQDVDRRRRERDDRLAYERWRDERRARDNVVPLSHAVERTPRNGKVA